MARRHHKARKSASGDDTGNTAVAEAPVSNGPLPTVTAREGYQLRWISKARLGFEVLNGWKPAKPSDYVEGDTAGIGERLETEDLVLMERSNEGTTPATFNPMPDKDEDNPGEKEEYPVVNARRETNDEK